MQQEQTKTPTKIDLTDGTRFVGIAIVGTEQTPDKFLVFVTQLPNGSMNEERIPMPFNTYLMFAPAIFLGGSR